MPNRFSRSRVRAKELKADTKYVTLWMLGRGDHFKQAIQRSKKGQGLAERGGLRLDHLGVWELNDWIGGGRTI